MFCGRKTKLAWVLRSELVMGGRGHVTPHMTGSTVHNQNKNNSAESETNKEWSKSWWRVSLWEKKLLNKLYIYVQLSTVQDKKCRFGTYLRANRARDCVPNFRNIESLDLLFCMYVLILPLSLSSSVSIYLSI